MDGYIKKSEAVDVIVKYPYEIAGKTATAIKIIEDLPSADVVPKSEVDKWYCEYHTIKDVLKQEKMYHRGTEKLVDKYCTELEKAKAEVEKLQNELVIWKQNRFNIFQRLECYETARQKVASEIFAEIEKHLIFNAYGIATISDKTFAELKKKYTEGEQ